MKIFQCGNVCPWLEKRLGDVGGAACCNMESSAVGERCSSGGKKSRILSDETLTYTQGYSVGNILPGGSNNSPKTVGELLALGADERLVESYSLQLHNMTEAVHTRRVVQDIVKYLEQWSLTANNDVNKVDKLGDVFPFDDTDALKAFDEKLKAKDAAANELRNSVKAFLQRYRGGRFPGSGHGAVRDIMEMIMEDNVTIRFNMKGRGKAKSAFADTELFNIVCELSNESDRTCTLPVVKEYVGNYLKQTKHRGKVGTNNGENGGDAANTGA
ncbi:hypothetical protein QAD02_020984 [Eretmocerus hayati]|uniref:Uncharacterized protein n=1 Tax=Eretmocerus hayati TaxID=131215 RepID=A0ACC2PNX2_9HYME|nr:hypothetical protein QAD02_020984 [Eretmocerus hayati]